MFKCLTGALLSLALAWPVAAQETIVVYFQKGFYPAEDKAVDELVEKFQKKTGVKVEISRYAPQEMIPKTVAALDSGSPPDMVYGDVFDFQCTKVQEGYRKKTGKRVYSVGSPMGVDSSDSFYSFLTYMDGYNVKLVNDDGKLNLGKETREGLINALRDYTETVGKGCTPPSAINWKDPDNNVNFHNKTIIMTHNATISIAAKWLDDMNNDKLKPDERAEAKENYEKPIATAGFPNKPDGKPMQYRAAVKVGVVFTAAKNKKRGKEFAAFLMQEENLNPYVEGALGRWYPVTKSGAASKFWTEDPHRKIVPDKWPVEKAVDEMIARIKEVAG